VAKRRRKSQFAKLRAKANKAVARNAKAVRKQARKRVRRVERALQSNSLARTAKRSSKRVTRQAKRSLKATLKQSRKLAKKSGKLRRRTLKAVRQARKRTSKALVSIRREYRRKQRNKAQRLRAANKALRAEQKQYGKLALIAEADLSGATIRQASDRSGASLPGEPPRMRTGKGRQSISAELRTKGKKIEARTFVDKKIAPYMAMWEFRRDGKQRPFLKPAVEDNLHMFGSAIGSSLRQSLKGTGGKKKAQVR
jgi:hypothetical protein